MSTIILKSTFELLAVILLIYGFIHEKELIEFENRLFRVISIKWKLYKKHRSQNSK